MGYPHSVPKIMYSTGPKRWDLWTEPDLDVRYSFSISVKFPVLLLEIEWHFDKERWLLRGFTAAPQGLEDGENGEKSVKMGAL